MWRNDRTLCLTHKYLFVTLCKLNIVLLVLFKLNSSTWDLSGISLSCSFYKSPPGEYNFTKRGGSSVLQTKHTGMVLASDQLQFPKGGGNGAMTTEKVPYWFEEFCHIYEWNQVKLLFLISLQESTLRKVSIKAELEFIQGIF